MTQISRYSQHAITNNEKSKGVKINIIPDENDFDGDTLSVTNIDKPIFRYGYCLIHGTTRFHKKYNQCLKCRHFDRKIKKQFYPEGTY